MDNSILAILSCPVSRTALKHLGREQVDRINDLITEGEVEYVQGERVLDPLENALITEDNRVIYPIRDGIPVLLADSGIGTTQFTDKQALGL